LDNHGVGNASFYVNDGLGHKEIYVNPTPLSLGAWYQVWFVVDRSSNTLRSYVNGVQDGSPPSIAGSGTFDSKSPANIGAEGNDGLSSFDGSLFYVRSFDRAYSPAEVLALYNAERRMIEFVK
jgi:hypothetical protein